MIVDICLLLSPFVLGFSVLGYVKICNWISREKRKSDTRRYLRGIPSREW